MENIILATTQAAGSISEDEAVKIHDWLVKARFNGLLADMVLKGDLAMVPLPEGDFKFVAVRG